LRQPAGKVFSSKGGQQGERKEGFEEMRQRLPLLNGWLYLQGLSDERAGKQCALLQNAVAVEAEFVEIGQDEVGEGVQVALELLGGLNLVEFCSRDFGFDVTNDVMRAVPRYRNRDWQLRWAWARR